MIQPAGHRLPPISQIAYMVEDLDAAIRFWTQNLGVGPFAVLPHIDFAEGEYLGQPVQVDLSIGLAWGRGVQIELMQQHSAANSVFSDHSPQNGGFHHVGIHTEDIRRDEAHLLASGFSRLQRNLSASGTETLFFGGVPGAGIVELIGSSANGPLSQRLRAAAAEWNGITEVMP